MVTLYHDTTPVAVTMNRTNKRNQTWPMTQYADPYGVYSNYSKSKGQTETKTVLTRNPLEFSDSTQAQGQQ